MKMMIYKIKEVNEVKYLKMSNIPLKPPKFLLPIKKEDIFNAFFLPSFVCECVLLQTIFLVPESSQMIPTLILFHFTLFFWATQKRQQTRNGKNNIQQTVEFFAVDVMKRGYFNVVLQLRKRQNFLLLVLLQIKFPFKMCFFCVFNIVVNRLTDKCMPNNSAKNHINAVLIIVCAKQEEKILNDPVLWDFKYDSGLITRLYMVSSDHWGLMDFTVA